MWGVCAHTCAGGTHLPLAFQPSTMFEGESSAATLIGVEGFTAVRFDTKRRVCRVWALHARCSWLLIDCVTSHSSHRLDWIEEYVFKKPYLSCHEGKLTTAEDKAHETLGACSLNEQLKAAVNKVPHHRNKKKNKPKQPTKKRSENKKDETNGWIVTLCIITTPTDYYTLKVSQVMNM